MVNDNKVKFKNQARAKSPEELSLREIGPNNDLFLSVFSSIQSESRKIRTSKNSVFRHFSRSVLYLKGGVFRRTMINQSL